MRTHPLSTSILVTSLLAGPSQAYWRLSCSLSQTSRIDPILSPNSVSGHVHKFAGASNVNAGSTYDSLIQAPCSTCEIQDDKSAYWTPTLYYQHSNGSFEEVGNQGMTVYYEGRGNNRDLRPFPPGFRMVSGNQKLRSSYDNVLIPGPNRRKLHDRASFTCLDGTGHAEEPWLYKTDCKDGLRVQMHFQSCWNGKDLYKPDNSHVEYMSDLDNGICPSTHSIPLIKMFYEFLYGVNDIQKDGGRFLFSNGDPTGYGFHGDFINGWKPDVLDYGVKNCAFDGDQVHSCASFKPSLDPNFVKNCPERPSLLNEPTKGMIDKLPGCITITPGPQDAQDSDLRCRDGHKRRSEPFDTAPEDEEYGYGYDFDLPATTTRGPPPTYGSPKPHHERSKRSEPLNTDSDEDYGYDYGYSYDWDLPTTTTRGPPPTYGSPKPHHERVKRSEPLDTDSDEDYGYDYGYGYDWDLPTTTTRGPPPSYGSPKPHHGRSNVGRRPADNVLEA